MELVKSHSNICSQKFKNEFNHNMEIAALKRHFLDHNLRANRPQKFTTYTM